MKCTNCGHMNDVDSKFCIKCGTKIIVSNGGEADQTISTSSDNENEDMNKFKTFADGFWKYYVDVILRPTSTVNHLDQKHLVNGLIMIFLFSLLPPLQVYFMFSGNRFIRLSFTSTVVAPFFYLLLLVVVIIGLIYAAIKIGKIDGDFLTVVSRFGGLLAIPVSLQLISLLLLKILPSVSLMLNILAYSGVIFAIVFTFQSFIKDKELKGDLIYYIYGILFVLIILFSLLGGSFMNQIGDLLYFW